MRLGPILFAGLMFAGCGDERQAGRGAAATPLSAENAVAPGAPAATPSSAEIAEASRDPAATPSSGGNAEAELRELFDGYYDALEARDWDAMCRTVAPEVTADVRKSLRIGGDPNPPRACPEAFEQFHAAVGDELSEELVGEMAETAQLDSVNIKGETAFLNWHYTDEGTLKALTQHARKIDGEWKLID
ncbi:MAG: hypothetical protein QOI10_3695 [Solirubrobacterales bacterium]|jgi:hypothetical protein|nr:hypothetical protein [Solirubrobacterales bacterium]